MSSSSIPFVCRRRVIVFFLTRNVVLPSGEDYSGEREHLEKFKESTLTYPVENTVLILARVYSKRWALP